MKPWHEKYLGKPWVADPNPPESFNCGELLRYIHKAELGIDTAKIQANAASLRECVDNMQADIFGLLPLPAGAELQDFDSVFFGRASKYEDHCGIIALTLDGPMILHCLQGAGVVLDSFNDAKALGFARLLFYRHRDMA